MPLLRQFRPLTEYNQEIWFKQASTDDTQAIFSILCDDELIGYCGLVYINYKDSHAELSFIVDPVRAGDEKTYKEDLFFVLDGLCQYGFMDINLNRIYTETYATREKHIKMVESYGFKLDGRLREHIFSGGDYMDSLIHSMLTSEWKKQHAYL